MEVLTIGDRTRAPTTQSALGVWDAETGVLLSTIPVTNSFGPVDNSTFSPDGKRLAAGDKIWDADTGQFLLSLGISGQVSFSPDGHRLAIVTSYSNEVTIYDATPLPEKP
jgi:WD40 repeat protein